MYLISYCMKQYALRFQKKPNGDGEIRTHDPLLARQVLSQLSYTPILIWQPPTLPCRLQHSTLGRPGLNLRVRDVDGCFPGTHRHQKSIRFSIRKCAHNYLESAFASSRWSYSLHLHQKSYLSLRTSFSESSDFRLFTCSLITKQ